MSIFDFVKGAGAKVLGAIPGADAAQKLLSHLTGSGVEGGRELQVEYDPTTATARVSGAATDQATREKLVLALGNVEGVEKVEEAIVVEKPEPEARFYTVKKGDTLSAIAKAHYGSANKYPVIFEANRPLLSHPDKIYPGQVLRIPEA
jgi:nucleoid-associated protein YgaU